MRELYSVAARFRVPIACAAVSIGLFGVAPLPAQVQMRAPQGVIAGQVVDSVTGAPIPYALLILEEGDVRAFANDAGRFALRAPSGGLKTLSVRQIGYAPVQIRLRIEPAPAGDRGSAPLTVRLSRQAFVLPDLVVEASSCESARAETDAEGGALLGLAFQNAERLLTLERTYPSRSEFQKYVRLMDANRSVVSEWTDTIRSLSLYRQPYRPGRVLRGEQATYFSVADIAESEFRKRHCFWFGGRDRDTASGIPVVRINFVPTAKTKTPDWAGSLMLDSATSVLLRSEAVLVNLPRRSSLTAARCIVDYTELAPTLVHESRAVCAMASAKLPGTVLVERWTLRRHEFLGQRPDSSAVPPPP